uniref:Dentin sialophosphoprotein-like n=1 Tax=Saccoglossus kowalevskii TaxID=10224 RepID=A0ABM0M7A7_SACKO|nr:PREDICTED: dentin sialophosphoprotein-like [Saccoglossus kowalevskii]
MASSNYSSKYSSNAVLVSGFPEFTNEDKLTIYFQSHRRSGGGDVNGVLIRPNGTAVVKFSESSAATNVLQRGHEFGGESLVVRHCPIEMEPDFEDSDVSDSSSDDEIVSPANVDSSSQPLNTVGMRYDKPKPLSTYYDSDDDSDVEQPTDSLCSHFLNTVQTRSADDNDMGLDFVQQEQQRLLTLTVKKNQQKQAEMLYRSQLAKKNLSTAEEPIKLREVSTMEEGKAEEEEMEGIAAEKGPSMNVQDRVKVEEYGRLKIVETQPNDGSDIISEDMTGTFVCIPGTGEDMTGTGEGVTGTGEGMTGTGGDMTGTDGDMIGTGEGITGTGEGMTGTGEGMTGTGGDMTGTGEDMTGTSGDMTGTGESVTGIGGDMTGTGEDMTGTGGDMTGTGEDMTGTGGDMTGTGEDMTGTGGDMTGTGEDMTGTGGNMTGTGEDMTGTGGDMTGTGEDMTGTGGNMTGTGGDMTGTGGDMTGTGGDMTGTGEDMTGTGGNMTGTGGDMTGTGGDMTGTGGDMTGTGEDMTGTGGDMTGTGGDMTGTGGDMTGTGGDMTGTGGDMTGTAGDMTGTGGDMTGTGGDMTGTGGDMTGTGGDMTGTGGDMTGTGGDMTGTGEDMTGTGGDMTGTGGDMTGTGGDMTGTGGDMTGTGGDMTGTGGDMTGTGGDMTGTGGDMTGTGGDMTASDEDNFCGWDIIDYSDDDVTQTNDSDNEEQPRSGIRENIINVDVVEDENDGNSDENRHGDNHHGLEEEHSDSLHGETMSRIDDNFYEMPIDVRGVVYRNQHNANDEEKVDDEKMDFEERKQSQLEVKDCNADNVVEDEAVVMEKMDDSGSFDVLNQNENEKSSEKSPQECSPPDQKPAHSRFKLAAYFPQHSTDENNSAWDYHAFTQDPGVNYSDPNISCSMYSEYEVLPPVEAKMEKRPESFTMQSYSSSSSDDDYTREDMDRKKGQYDWEEKSSDGSSIVVIQDQEHMKESKEDSDLDEEDVENTIEVTDFSANTTAELLEMYFENRRKSGGGKVLKVEIASEKAYVTFEDPKVIDTVLQKTHLLNKCNLKVRIAPPLPPRDKRKVVVKNISEKTTRDGLELYMENISGCDVEKIENALEADVAMVTFKSPPDYDKMFDKISKRALDGSFLYLHPVSVTNSILVAGISQSTSTDTLELYFENKRRSGGGDVQDTSYDSDTNTAVVQFEDPKVVENVCQNRHILNGADLTVVAYHECFGPPACMSEFFKPNLPDPFTIEVDPNIIEFIKNAGCQRVSDFDEMMKLLKVSLIWDDDIKTLINVWESQAKDAIEEFLDDFSSREIKSPVESWQEICTRLEEIKSASMASELWIAKDDTNKSLTITGLKAAVSMAINSYQKIAKEIEEKMKYEATIITDQCSSVKREKLQLLQARSDAVSIDENIKMDIAPDQGSVMFRGPSMSVTGSKLKILEMLANMVDKGVEIIR